MQTVWKTKQKQWMEVKERYVALGAGIERFAHEPGLGECKAGKGARK